MDSTFFFKVKFLQTGNIQQIISMKRAGDQDVRKTCNLCPPGELHHVRYKKNFVIVTQK